MQPLSNNPSISSSPELHPSETHPAGGDLALGSNAHPIELEARAPTSSKTGHQVVFQTLGDGNGKKDQKLLDLESPLTPRYWVHGAD